VPGIHDDAQAPHQGPPGQDQVTGGRVQDTPIDAVANQIVVWGLRVGVCVERRDGRKRVTCEDRSRFCQVPEDRVDRQGKTVPI
jgi:hypothetical protein